MESDGALSAPLVITEQITLTPTGGGWFYVRTWHMAGHPQSGIDCVERISPYIIISEAAAMAEAHRSGVHIEADLELLKLWDNNGSVH